MKAIEQLAHHFYDRGQLKDDQIKYLNEKGYISEVPLGYCMKIWDGLDKKFREEKRKTLRERQPSARFPNGKLGTGYYAGKNYKLRAGRAARRFSTVAIQEQLS